MSERKQALVELRNKVKAGTWDTTRDEPHWSIKELRGWSLHIDRVMDEHDLNAAKALMQAALPDEGWEICRTAKYPGMVPGSSPYPFRAEVGWGTVHIGEAADPARAWLIAILEALIAKEG